MGVPEVEAEETLKKTLTRHRFRHTLGVRDMSERLARIHGLDAAAARVAGLLHDAAKCLPEKEQRRLAAGLADEGELANPELLHAPAARRWRKRRSACAMKRYSPPSAATRWAERK